MQQFKLCLYSTTKGQTPIAGNKLESPDCYIDRTFRRFIPIVMFLAFHGIGLSQDLTKEFEIKLPAYKVHQSLYDSIQFVDCRPDKTNLGIVQVGPLNKPAKVVFKTPVYTQVNSLFKALTDSSASKGIFLFKVKQFSFSEHTYPLSEIGYCGICIELYAKNEFSYQKINFIDTVLQVRSLDVTIQLLKNGGDFITKFISDNLLQRPKDSACYSYKEALNMDSVEKRKITLYNAEKYTDGIYCTYQSFFNQKPDLKIFVKARKSGKIVNVKFQNARNELEKIDPIYYYAIVYNGRPYISTRYGYYPLEKKNDDFYFTGDVSISSVDRIVGAAFWLGLIGAAFASMDHATFLVKINHKNGKFIPEKEIKAEEY